MSNVTRNLADAGDARAAAELVPPAHHASRRAVRMG
jgi:hypothetical protein